MLGRGKRPASLQEELPGTVIKKQCRTATAAATAPVSNSNGDSQEAGIDCAPDTTRQEPQQQGCATVTLIAKPDSTLEEDGIDMTCVGNSTKTELECRFCAETFSRATTSIFKYVANDLIKEKKGDDRSSQRLDLKKRICAMLNGQETGILVFHANDCHILNKFHLVMDDELEKLIPDGSSFADTFDRKSLKQNHFRLRVKPRKDSPILSTLDFHTSSSLDKGLKRKCGHYQMQTELKKAQNGAHHSPVPDRELPKDSDFKLGQEVIINGDTYFQENKYLQAKAIGDTRQSSLKALLWDIHGLGKYIAAFSKLAEGGTVLFGIREKTDAKFICEGVKLTKGEEEHLKLELKNNIDTLFWVASQTNTNAETSPGTVDFIRLPDDSGDRCIIRMRVNEYNGICFLRKNGPESYKLDEHDEPIEIQPWSEWAKRSNCEDLVPVERPFE